MKNWILGILFLFAAGSTSFCFSAVANEDNEPKPGEPSSITEDFKLSMQFEIPYCRRDRRGVQGSLSCLSMNVGLRDFTFNVPVDGGVDSKVLTDNRDGYSAQTRVVVEKFVNCGSGYYFIYVTNELWNDKDPNNKIISFGKITLDKKDQALPETEIMGNPIDLHDSRFITASLRVSR